MATLARLVHAARRTVDALVLGVVLIGLLSVGFGKLVPLTGNDVLVIGGPSMEPSIPIGSAAVIEPVDPRALRSGDVVSVRAMGTGALVTHRVTRLVEDSAGLLLETKGDANPLPDPDLVPAGGVVGRVAWSLPLVGYLMTLLSLPLGVALFIGIACTLLAVATLLDTIELRAGANGRGLLRKTPVRRVEVGFGVPPAGRPMWASTTGPAIATRLSGGTGPAHRIEPDEGGWRPAGTRRRH
jgi:signal peptidase